MNILTLKVKSKRNICQNISFQISNGLSELFYRIGYTVAIHPWNTIICSILLVICCSAGLLSFHKEKNPLNLWIPEAHWQYYVNSIPIMSLIKIAIMLQGLYDILELGGVKGPWALAFMSTSFESSKFIKDTLWLTERFEEGYRLQNVLITDEDVLRPEVLQKLATLSKEITKVTATAGNGTVIGWNDVCFKIPVIAELTKPSQKRRRKREPLFDFDFDDDMFDEELSATKRISIPSKPFNPSVDLNPTVFCGIIENLPTGCLMRNILEIWNFDEKVIGSLTKDEILDKLNTTTISSSSGHESDFVGLLGGVKRNSSGHIVSATALMSHWMVYLNFSEIDHDKTGNAAGTEDFGSEEALLWENAILQMLKRLKTDLFNNGTEVFYEAARSFGDISSATMFQDMDKLLISGVIMFVYLQTVLSKFNWVEFRLILGSMALLSIGMAFIASIGICSIMGVSYGPVHTALPFLMMGLGVDDMFVMMACWRQIQTKYAQHTIPERMALMLQHAGASVTITSFTDVVAFAIGASTILPSLQSFCIYAAVGVFLTYIFAITFVVAIFTLDERRIQQKRDPILPCIIHKDASTELLCNRSLAQKALKAVYSKVIFTKPGKIIVITTVLALTIFSTNNLFQLKQKFDQSWFIPDTTYLHSFLKNHHEYYPDAGLSAGIFMGKLNYTTELPKICKINELLKNQTDLVYDVNFWIDPFQNFVEEYFDKDVCSGNVTENEFELYLSNFLYSSSGGKYQENFKFETKLKCGQPVPPIKISSLIFRYRSFEERNVYVPAMHAIDDMVKDMHFSSGDGYSTVWGKIYANWITDEVIDTELIRNVTLALVSVMVCTILLIANISICFYIFVTVVLTLVNVCGFMYMWGLTIDLVSCIALQLAVGLCVDYAAHIGHTFLTISTGTKSERSLQTVLQIGEAVFAGGFSTLLALLMLANSEAYIFQAFFKIFLLVIVFGLFHGVVFLPVILSIVGPEPYEVSVQSTHTNGTTDSIRLKPPPPCNDDDESNCTEMTNLQHRNEIDKK